MQNFNTSVPVMTTGLDLGDRYSHYHTLDAAGQKMAAGRIPTRGKPLEEYFRKQPSHRVVCEVGAHSPWISRLLKQAGHEVVVANARRVQLIAQNSRKTDSVDAELLARLGRIDPKLLSPIQHRSEAQQADLAVLRSRDAMVSVRTELVNHARGVIKSFGGRLATCSTASFHRRGTEGIPEALKPALTPILDIIRKLNDEIRGYDRKIEELGKNQYAESDRLTQVTGVGSLTAVAFMLILEDPKRFEKTRAAGSYVGLCPRKQESSEQDPQLRISKEGSPFLRRLMVQSAHYIMGPFGPDCDLRRFGERIGGHGGKNARKRAVVAVARKLTVLLLSLWKTGEKYDPFRQSGEKTEPEGQGRRTGGRFAKEERKRA